MGFNSWSFVAFLGIVWGAYYLPWLRGRQVLWLTLASLVFYAWEAPVLLLLFIVSSLVAAYTSYRVLHERQDFLRKGWALGGVAFNLGLLAFFKYKHLFVGTLALDPAGSGSAAHWLFTLPLPIGISFYTFHGISLLVDVYRRGEAAIASSALRQAGFRAHYRDSLLYLVFFPQLISGPIVKAHDFFPQIGAKRLAEVDWLFVARSLIVGYFLKSVIADNLAEQTFWMDSYANFSSLNLLIFLFGYSIQIFADFAGYSLIALGLAALFGYYLPINFNYPYLSASFAEFWQRWHISLSSWLREYLYLALGGNRAGKLRTYFNLLLVMVLGGLWHGAGWSYAVWGLLHGSFLVLERPWREHALLRSGGLWRGLRMILVFAAVSLAWLLFRLPDFSQAWGYFSALCAGSRGALHPSAFLILLYTGPVIAYHLLELRRERAPAFLARLSIPGHAALLAAVVLNAGHPHAFIYFQF